MSNNRSNFKLHVAIAFVTPMFALAYVALGAYMLGVHGQWFPAIAAVAGVVACLYIFVKMIVHAVAAVAREIDEQRRRQTLRTDLAKAMNAGMDRALQRPLAPRRPEPPRKPEPPNGRKAA